MSALSSPINPNPSHQFRFTWEAQSHVPTLRLYLFNTTKSNLHVTTVNATHIPEQFTLSVTFSQAVNIEYSTVTVNVNVPVPRVLIDSEAKIMCKAYDCYIEVKLVLLLPIDNPLLSGLSGDENVDSDEVQPLCMDYDLERFSTLEEVYFYCRNCSAKLTTALRLFEEMPSVNWQDVADNWFGGCCCSFGGIGDKLVMKFAKSYKLTPGVCLLSRTSVILCKDDLLECGFSNGNGEKEDDFKSAGDEVSALSLLPSRTELTRSSFLKNQTVSFQYTNGEVECLSPDENHPTVNIDSISTANVECNNLCCTVPNISFTVPTRDEHMTSSSGTSAACCPHEGDISNYKEQIDEINGGLLEDQKSFLNGYLGNGFMEKSSGISKDIKWSEYLCPQCSHLLGGYPWSGESSPLDGRVRLFKSSISSSLPVGGSNDLLRNYTLERMFTSQLQESAKDELSFRTVVRDLQTHDPVVQIILLNPNLWYYTGCCPDTKKEDMRMNMRPAIKVLFYVCSNNEDCVSRDLKGWVSKDRDDEVYMLPTQVEELIGTLELSKDIYPPSDIFLQGFYVSSLNRSGSVLYLGQRIEPE